MDPRSATDQFQQLHQQADEHGAEHAHDPVAGRDREEHRQARECQQGGTLSSQLASRSHRPSLEEITFPVNYANWAIQRRWEQEDPSPHEQIGHLIRSEYNAWP